MARNLDSFQQKRLTIKSDSALSLPAFSRQRSV